MSPITSEDVPQSPGSANASMNFGDASKVKAMQREVQSRTGNGQPPSAQPQGPQAPQPQGAQPQPPGEAVQPEPGRLDMGQVFPPMPQLEQQPGWRDLIREQAQVWADHPQAGPAWAKFADLIKDQHGPLDK